MNSTVFEIVTNKQKKLISNKLNLSLKDTSIIQSTTNLNEISIYFFISYD